MKIGVLTDCLKLPPKEAIARAAEMGFTGVQIYATHGDFNAGLLDDRAKLDGYLKLLRDKGLTLSALCGDFGGRGFGSRSDNPERVAKTKRVIDLARACGTAVVTTHIGVVPEDERSETFRAMLEALDEVGRYGKERGVTLAIETGPEKPETLKNLLDKTHGGVGVNLDPANFVMVTGVDPAHAVDVLAAYIVHTHVKDGVMLKAVSGADVYGEDSTGGAGAGPTYEEKPLGEGGVNFDTYLAALKRTGYDGFFTIEREAGDNPEADIAAGAAFIRGKLARAGYK